LIARDGAIAGDMAMPLLLLSLLIGVVVVVLYQRNAGGVRIFDGGEAYILIDGGTLRLRKGWVPPRILSALADLLRDAGVSQGHITLSQDRRVAVSWHVPPALHQQIRNVLLGGQ
jgi:Protein of unknown function (DUF3634)